MKSFAVVFVGIITISGGVGLAAQGVVTRQQEFRQCRGVKSSMLPNAQLIELNDSLMDCVLTCGVQCNKDFMCKRFFICLKSFPVCRMDIFSQDEELSDACYCFDKVHINIPSTTENTDINHSQPIEKSTLPSLLNGVFSSSIPYSINASQHSPTEVSRTSPVGSTTVTKAPSVITEALDGNDNEMTAAEIDPTGESLDSNVADDCESDKNDDIFSNSNDNDDKDNADDSEDNGKENNEDIVEHDK